MNRVRRQRLLWVMGSLVVAALGVALLLTTMRRHIEYYQTPSQVNVHSRQTIMLGGMVVKGSVHHTKPLITQFQVTDFKRTITVHYRGVLPALFREGQGVIMHGRMTKSGVLMASSVLAKHDQYYRPPGLPAHQPGISR